MLARPARIAPEFGVPSFRKRFMIFSSTRLAVTSRWNFSPNQLVRRRTSARSTGSLPSSEGSGRSEEHTSELQSLMRISYAVFCLKKKREDATHALTPHINLQALHSLSRSHTLKPHRH